MLSRRRPVAHSRPHDVSAAAAASSAGAAPSDASSSATASFSSSPPGAIIDMTEGAVSRVPSRAQAHSRAPGKEHAQRGLHSGKSDGDGDANEDASIWEDLPSIALLTFLYFLQGLPIGIAVALVGMLKESGASYYQMSEFLLCSWPFSLKILWAPVVDSIYLHRFGRRKTWLVPVQFGIGIGLFLAASRVQGWLDVLDVAKLTATMFCLYFLAATQDIVVDGWALTMLKKKGWASLCNSIGQSIGVLFASSGYYLLASYKVVDMPGFLKTCAVTYIIATTLVAVFVHENASRKLPSGRSLNRKKSKQPVTNPWRAYKAMWRVVRLPIVRQLLFVLVTWKFGFACTDAALFLKLQDKAFSKEKITFLRTLMSPVELTIPMLISTHITGKRPFDLAVWSYLPRLALGVVACGLIASAPPKEEVGLKFTCAAIAFMLVQTVLSTVMFTSQLSFFARVSDPSIGGSYMTLLNTFANLGYLWTTMFTTTLVDYFTIRSKSNPKEVQIDGIYSTCAVCVSVGLIWFLLMRGRIERMQKAPLSAWRVGANSVPKPFASL